MARREIVFSAIFKVFNLYFFFKVAGLKCKGLDNSMNVFGNSITLLSKQESVNLSNMFERFIHHHQCIRKSSLNSIACRRVKRIGHITFDIIEKKMGQISDIKGVKLK